MKMRTKIGKSFIALGLVLMITALSVFFWNKYDSYKAGSAASDALLKLMEAMDDGGNEATDTEMKVKMIDGYGYIGYVTIDPLDIKLPVMSEWDYSRLKIAPCRYSGSTKTNDLVIAAHNYYRHFGRFTKLKVGQSITFKDMDKVVTNYRIVAIDILSPTAIDEMKAGDYDLTLFTCTYGGKSRITVRCERAE